MDLLIGMALVTRKPPPLGGTPVAPGLNRWARRRPWRSWAGRVLAAAALLWLVPAQAHDCRIAFDLGSSGVRSAASGVATDAAMPYRDIDLLTPLMAGQPIDGLLNGVEAALTELPRRAGWPAHCQKMGAGFSAWRLALRQDTERTIAQLELLRQRTGVAVLVIPAATEGQYGHASAAKTLGPRLLTSHVLDIGGGSMQVGGAERSFGVELGQKSWRHLLCQALGRSSPTPCVVQPLSTAQLAQARELIDAQLHTLPAEVGSATLTATSRPVTRGIRQALKALNAPATEDMATLSLAALSQAIDRLAGLTTEEAARLSQSPPAFVDYLLPDMLLVEAVMRASGNTQLWLAEAPINNLPALLRDQRAYDWAERHACYLQRLKEQGLQAFLTDPAGCPKP